MKTAVYFCNCSGNISNKIDPAKLRSLLTTAEGAVHFKDIALLCSEAGKVELERDIKKNKIDRVVIAACSPRDHEETFMGVLSKADINPYLMHMVNIREQVAWVTEDQEQAIEKAARYVRAAIKRVRLQEPLVKKEIDICPDVLVIGAGPAGLKAAVTIAESGRTAVVVEKNPVIGGRPVRYDEVFPNLECGPCMLEPLLDEVLHGSSSEQIELLTMSEIVDVTGFYGNFFVKIRKAPRYVDSETCIGCAACIDACPVSRNDDSNCAIGSKAISIPFIGSLPNVPSIDEKACLRFNGKECDVCKKACPVPNVIRYDEQTSILERNVGAIVIATGSDVYDCTNIPNLDYHTMTEVYTSLEFEILVSSNTHNDKGIRTSRGEEPENIGIIHCVGSLDSAHKEYCSEICCLSAMKYSQMIAERLPRVRIFHFYKELVLPGKDGFALFNKAKENRNAQFIRYRDIRDFKYYYQQGEKGKKGEKILAGIEYKDERGKGGFERVDMIILCPALIASEGSAHLGNILGAALDKKGFFKERHERMDASQSTMKGIYLAGTCQSPMDIQKAMSQAMASSGHILSGLIPGRRLQIAPTTACIDENRCSGCMVCVPVCPFKAITAHADTSVARVNEVLCQGCGTCVSACPIDAITGNHFTSQQMCAEIEGILDDYVPNK